MSQLSGYDELVECPYNRAHQILSSRFELHLVKCRKQHPNAEKATCLFNATHIINKAEMKLHLERCPDRANLEQYRFNLASSASNQQRQQQHQPQQQQQQQNSERGWGSSSNTRNGDQDEYWG